MEGWGVWYWFHIWTNLFFRGAFSNRFTFLNLLIHGRIFNLTRRNIFLRMEILLFVSWVCFIWIRLVIQLFWNSVVMSWNSILQYFSKDFLVFSLVAWKLWVSWSRHILVLLCWPLKTCCLYHVCGIPCYVVFLVFVFLGSLLSLS